jgi:tRNA 2-selenouridine synthase SelU
LIWKDWLIIEVLGDRSSAAANNRKQSVFHSSEFKSTNPWVEDESRLIGQVSIPDAFYTKMRDLPVYFLDVPLERTKHLVTTYASLSHDQLADAISRIAKRLGYDNAKFAQKA